MRVIEIDGTLVQVSSCSTCPVRYAYRCQHPLIKGGREIYTAASSGRIDRRCPLRNEEAKE
mgnify:FL=1